MQALINFGIILIPVIIMGVAILVAELLDLE